MVVCGYSWRENEALGARTKNNIAAFSAFGVLI
jgi:hypothetical protein